MRISDAKKQFVEMNKDWIEENKNDKIKVNLAYRYYLDKLCRDGEITLRQWQNAANLLRSK